MRIIVSGGGTAGHLSPILAVVEKLRALDPAVEILYIGSGSSIEARMLEQVDVAYKHISSGKFRRYRRGLIKEALDVKTNAQNARDAVKLSRGILQAKRIVKKFKPNVIFAKGGYVGVPVALAAKKFKIPLVIHESDSVLGLANRYLAKRADVIATGFPTEVYPKELQPKLTFVGNPVAQSSTQASEESVEVFFNFKNDVPTILIFGGSRGAHKFNLQVFENLKLICRNYQLIHLTGEADIEQARFLKNQLEANFQAHYKPYDFLTNQMGLAYKACDIVVSRAGASTIAELAIWQKPAIILPLPTSANNHQHQNAKILAAAGAVRNLTEHEIEGVGLVAAIDKLIGDKTAMKYLAENVAKFAKPNAAGDLAKLIIKTSLSGRRV